MGKAALSLLLANEIAPAIGGCLLAFDVRLVKCTGCDPRRLKNTRLLPLQVSGLFVVSGSLLASNHESEMSGRGEQQACSIITLPSRESCAYSNLTYLIITLTALLPAVFAHKLAWFNVLLGVFGRRRALRAVRYRSNKVAKLFRFPSCR